MPLIIHVEAELLCAKRRRTQRIGTGRVADAVLAASAGGNLRAGLILKSGERRVEVVADGLGQEEVLELEQLVVRAEDDRVVALQDREVIGDLSDLLIERVRGGEALC